MTKTKPNARLNQVFAMLVKSKPSKVAVANALNISPQSLGYYIKGRKIPVTVIEKWKEVYGQNLLELSEMDFEADLDTIIKNGTQANGTNGSHEKKFDQRVAEESINAEAFKRLQKDHEMFEKELNRAWDLIDRLLPKAKTQPIKRVNSNEGK